MFIGLLGSLEDALLLVPFFLEAELDCVDKASVLLCALLVHLVFQICCVSNRLQGVDNVSSNWNSVLGLLLKLLAVIFGSITFSLLTPAKGLNQ